MKSQPYLGYCISCDKEDKIFVAPWGEYHLKTIPYYEIDACEGPFATCPPPPTWGAESFEEWLEHIGKYEPSLDELAEMDEAAEDIVQL